MKSRTQTIILVLIVLAIVLAPVVFFFGNPISYLLIPLLGNSYLAETYPDLDVKISDVRYDFKAGGWSAMAVSPTSRDTWFPVYIDGFGNVLSDGYLLFQTGGTTAERIARDYRELSDGVLESVPLDTSVSFAELTFLGGVEYYSVPGPDGKLHHYSMEKDYGLDISTLELDADYDIAALGAKHGRITIYVHDEEVTVEKAAEVLLELKAYFDETGLPFYGIHLNLCKPRNENGQMNGKQINLYDFLYEDIYEEDLIKRVKLAWAETKEHYARRDGYGKEEPVPETTVPVETTLPPETTTPVSAAMTIENAAALLDFSADPNWLARALGCTFERPEDVDLEYMFYLGVEHPGSWGDICGESRQLLTDQGFWVEMDIQIMPVEKLEDALQATFGVGLDAMTIPEGWAYIEAENAWCSNHNDAYFPGVPNITSVEDDGETIVIHYTIDGYWIPDSGEFLDPAHLALTLKRQADGSIHAVSNVLAP